MEFGAFVRFKKVILDIFSNISVEPVSFLYFMALLMQGIVREDLYLQKVCQVDEGIEVDICKELQQHEQQQIQVRNTELLKFQSCC